MREGRRLCQYVIIPRTFPSYTGRTRGCILLVEEEEEEEKEKEEEEEEEEKKKKKSMT